jgi:hypothetical protein
MTARYGLPDHLISIVGSAVTEIAVYITLPGTPEYELAWEWADRVDDGDHEDLFMPEDARSLHKLMKEVAEYVYSNPTEYTVDVTFAIHAEEILSFLAETANPQAVAA